MVRRTIRLKRARVAILCLLAAFMVLLNALKPLTIDDTFFCAYARQISVDPQHPFDFQLNWREWETPAVSMAPPPVVPVWLSLSMALFPDQPATWKLSLIVFALLFVFGLHSIARRLVGRYAVPVVAIISLSPAILPSLNLMVDVPVQGLVVAAVAMQVSAVKRERLWYAVAAGLLGGLATQTKYTGLIAPSAVLLIGCLYGQVRLGIVAFLTAMTCFGGWELLMRLLIGHSPFLYTWKYQFAAKSDQWTLVQSLIYSLGLINPAAILLGKFWNRSIWWLLSLVPLFVLCCGVPYLPSFDEKWCFIALTLPVLLHIATGIASVRRGPVPTIGRVALSWLLLEVLGFLFISPFCAVRRLLGLVITSTLFLAFITVRSTTRLDRSVLSKHLHYAVALNAACGLMILSLDWIEATAAQRAVDQVIAAVRPVDPKSTIWFMGHWGFQFYAERRGMRPCAADESEFSAGDWLAVPSPNDLHPTRTQDIGATRKVREIVIDDPIIWTTVPAFYHGLWPIARRTRVRHRVELYRVNRSSRYVSAIHPGILDEAVRRLQGSVFGEQALRALRVSLQDSVRERRLLTAKVLAALGPIARRAEPDLESALSDKDEQVREAICNALEVIGFEHGSTIEHLKRIAALDPSPEVRSSAARAVKTRQHSKTSSGKVDNGL